MRVVELTLFMSGGIEMTFKANEKGMTEKHLNHALKSLEEKVPSFALDLEDDDGQKSRVVVKTESVYFYRAVFGEPLLTYSEFSNRVEKRLREAEYNHNIVRIEISLEDLERFYPAIPRNENLPIPPDEKLRYFGRELATNRYLRTGEFELVSDKGEVI